MRRTKWGETGKNRKQRVGCGLSPYSKHGHTSADGTFVVPGFLPSTLCLRLVVTREGTKNSHPGPQEALIQGTLQCYCHGANYP